MRSASRKPSFNRDHFALRLRAKKSRICISWAQIRTRVLAFPHALSARNSCSKKSLSRNMTLPEQKRRIDEATLPIIIRKPEPPHNGVHRLFPFMSRPKPEVLPVPNPFVLFVEGQPYPLTLEDVLKISAACSIEFSLVGTPSFFSYESSVGPIAYITISSPQSIVRGSWGMYVNSHTGEEYMDTSFRGNYQKRGTVLPLYGLDPSRAVYFTPDLFSLIGEGWELTYTGRGGGT